MVKNIRKLTILLIAVVAIGAFALPNVITASLGQHTFVQVDTIDCMKCHASSGAGVGLELNNSGNVKYYAVPAGYTDTDDLNSYPGGYVQGMKIHSPLGCHDCHTVSRLGRNIPTSDHIGIAPHPVCTDCHGHIIGAGIELNGASEMHKGLVAYGTAACVGCHTAVTVSGSVSYSFTPETQDMGYGLTINSGI